MVAVKKYLAHSARELIPIYHFQNDVATVECSTPVWFIPLADERGVCR